MHSESRNSNFVKLLDEFFIIGFFKYICINLLFIDDKIRIMDWYLKVWKQYADFSGRARRKEYWMFYLFNVIVEMLLVIILGIVAVSIMVASRDESLLFLAASPAIIYGLAIFIPNLAVTVRRLHDTGKSGWWFFISLIPLVGGIWLLVILCTDSQFGANKWGDNPKGIGYNLQNFEKY